MPFELNPANGKWEHTGPLPDDSVPIAPSPIAEEEAKPTPKKVESNKPWWQKAGDFIGGAIEKQNPLARYVPNPVAAIDSLRKGELPPSIKNLQNDLQFEVNQLTASPQSAISRMGSHSTDAAMSFLPTDVKNTLKLGSAKATANASKALLDLPSNPIVNEYLLGNPPSEGFLTPEREGSIDEGLDTYYRANGFKPPSEMTEDELAGDDMRASLVLNGMLAIGTMGASSWASGTALAAKFPALARVLGFADVTKAKTLLGGAARFTFGQVLDEIPSTFLDDNTGGSGQQLLGLAVGVVNPEAGAAISASDPAIQPGLTRTQSSQAAFLPNLTASLALGGGLAGLAKGLPATQRAISAANTRMRRQASRQALVENNIVVEDDAGKTAFSPAVFETMGELEEVMTNLTKQVDQAKAADPSDGFTGPVLEKPLPEPLPDDIDPWTMEYDPQILEADAALEVIESQLDDLGLDELLMRSQSENTAEVLDEISSRNTGAPVRDDVAYESSAAPVDAIATSGAVNERFSSVPTDTLRSLASPQNSPALANKIKQLTGKDPSTFDRIDVLEGITALEADGRTVMPSRLMGQPTLMTGEIKVDPQRFQFKQGVDAQGQQKGNSLTGVDVWNEDMEGAVQVWTDPLDGNTYVVNGHNRLAKAKELGIPSMKVEYINAPTAEAARSKGALTNIAQGGGTAFDAAKFFKDYGGVTLDSGDLEALGVPMKSGLAVEGLALSKLPDNIFQDAIDNVVSKGKALALGGSGLDEAGMQQAYKALQARDISDTTFNEVIQQAKSAPTVQGDQVDLFGNTDMLNLMVQKGELAARIKRDLGQTRRAANSASKNVQTLEGVGNQINKEGTKSLADDTAALLAEFDANKYMDGPTSQLLNEGAEQIANGARLNVVADRIRRQLTEVAEGMPAPEKVAEEVVEAQAPVIPRDEKIKQIVQQAARKGEVRPPSTPLPQSPAVPEVDVNQRADVATLEVLDNEARLMGEFEAIDAALAADQLAAGRANNGYDGMTFEQKKGAGMLDGLAKSDQIDIPEKASRPITERNRGRIQGTANQLRNWANNGLPPEKQLTKSDSAWEEIVRKKGRLLDTTSIPELDIDQALNDRAIGRVTPATEAVSRAYRQFYGLGDKPRRLSDQMRGQLDDLGQSMGKFTRTVDEVMDRQGAGIADRMKAAIAESNELDKQMARKIGQHIDDQSAGLRELADTMQPSALPPAEFVIPKDLSKSAPRFGMAKLEFESDLDRAAYMIRNKAKKSKGEDRMIAALKEQGYDVDEIRQLGDEVKAKIQDGVEEVTGSRRAPQEQFTVQVPKSALASTSAPRLSRTGPQASKSGEYSEAKTRKMLENAEAFRKSGAEAALLDVGLKLPSRIIGLERISKRLSSEMVDGLKDAARISGLDPLRVQYLEKIEMRKLFGDADSNEALEQWRPDLARFARENPGDPLIDIADGVTGGVYVPRDYTNTHRHMIYLAMGPSLDKRLASPGIEVGGGTPMQRTAYHESFHAVQDWLDSMSAKGVDETRSLKAAMATNEAIAEMTKIVKNDRFGNFQEGMDLKELQAEAFATWYNNRKLRLKAGGLQAGFEKIKKFINDLRRRWKKALDKEPGYVDVFELAAAGKIADGGNKAIAKLRPEQLEALKGRIDSNMDAMLPELTDRVQSYLKAKQAEFDVLADKLADEIDMEGC